LALPSLLDRTEDSSAVPSSSWVIRALRSAQEACVRSRWLSGSRWATVLRSQARSCPGVTVARPSSQAAIRPFWWRAHSNGIWETMNVYSMRLAAEAARESERWRASARFRARSASANSANSANNARSEEHTSELQSRFDLVCRL